MPPTPDTHINLLSVDVRQALYSSSSKIHWQVPSTFLSRFFWNATSDKLVGFSRFVLSSNFSFALSSGVFFFHILLLFFELFELIHVHLLYF